MFRETKGTRIRGREAKVGRKDADIIWTCKNPGMGNRVETQTLGSGTEAGFRTRSKAKA